MSEAGARLGEESYRLIRDALDYARLSPAARSLFATVLRYSLREGLDYVEFRTRRLIEFETELSESSRSKAFGELERAGILKRDHKGRGPFRVDVQIEFWRWNVRWVCASMADEAVCKDIVGGRHPLQQWQRSQARKPSAQQEMFAAEVGLSDTLREVARDELVELSSQESSRGRRDTTSGVPDLYASRPPLPRGEVVQERGASSTGGTLRSQGRENDGGNGIGNGVVTAGGDEGDNDLESMAEKLFGDRYDRRLRGLTRKLAAKNRRALYRTLAQGLTQRKTKPIQWPHGWLTDVFSAYEKACAKETTPGAAEGQL